MNKDKSVIEADISIFSEMQMDSEALKFFLESLPLGIVFWDHKRQRIKVSRTLAQNLGYTNDEIEGMSWMDLVCPLFFSLNENNYQQILNGEINSYQLTKLCYKKNGDGLDLRVDAFSYYSKQTETRIVFGLYQICEPFYKKYLSKIHPQFQAFVNAERSPGIIILAEEGQVLYGNRNAASFLGYSEKEIARQLVTTILEPEQAEAVLSGIRIMTPGKFFECDLTLCSRKKCRIRVPAQVILDNTNCFKNGRLLLIIFYDGSETDDCIKNGSDEHQINEIVFELRKINDSIKSLHKNSPSEILSESKLQLSGYGLTAREAEVLSMLLERKNTKEIAYSLSLAEITIRKYLTGLYRKFGVLGREDLLLLLHDKKL